MRRRFDELKHRFGLLEKKMEADMKVLQAEKKQSKAESDSAIERLRTDILRDIKSTSEASATRIMIVIGISVAFLSGVIGFVGFLLNGKT